jgi:universal stress protein E
MEKLTSILAVVDDPANATTLTDKAVFLARCFGARVELLVCDYTQAHGLAAHCTERGYDEVTMSSVHRGAEPLHEIVLRQVMQKRPDLVMKNPAGNHPVRRWSFADNDWQLASECPVPVMLVGPQAWTQPMRFAAAVDVSIREGEGVARGILQSAGMLALGCRANLDVLYSERETRDETVRMERAVKLAQLVREFHVGCERLQMFIGAPEKTLPGVIASRRYDVLVLGAVTHHAGLTASVAGLTEKLVDAVESDVVLVKASERLAARRPMSAASGREQVLHQAQ